MHHSHVVNAPLVKSLNFCASVSFLISEARVLVLEFFLKRRGVPDGVGWAETDNRPASAACNGSNFLSASSTISDNLQINKSTWWYESGFRVEWLYIEEKVLKLSPTTVTTIAVIEKNDFWKLNARCYI